MPIPPYTSHLQQPSGPASSASSRAPIRRTLKKFSSVSNLDSARTLSSAPSIPNLTDAASSRSLQPPAQLPFARSSPAKPPVSQRLPPSSYVPSSASHVSARTRTIQRAKSTEVMNAGAERRASSGLATRRPSEARAATLESVLKKKPAMGDVRDALQELRYLVLTEGIKSDKDGHSPLRIYIWSILLSVPPMRSQEYLSLIRRGASPAYSKIRNDTFRTLATDILFRRNVTEFSLIRVLNAHAWALKDAGHSTLYVQGMNVIAAPFLYAAKSEVEAFSLFSRFVRKECPGYVRPTMEGVHKGLQLVDECLETVDPKLYNHLKAKGLQAEIYAFPSILTLSACTPPLNEVLPLWDFLIAYGAHLNVLCVVAQLLLMRDTLLSAPSPVKHLRTFPPLRSNEIISVAVSLVKRIPSPIYERLVTHAK